MSEMGQNAPELRHKRLSAPKPIPRNEWQRVEKERGSTFPRYIIPLRARPKTVEQQKLYEEVQEEAEKLAKFMFEAYPHPYLL